MSNRSRRASCPPNKLHSRPRSAVRAEASSEARSRSGYIRTQAVPAFTRPDGQLIYDIFAELNDTRALSDATYGRGLAFFGLDLMIELVTTAGLYTMIALMLTVFDPPNNRFDQQS